MAKDSERTSRRARAVLLVLALSLVLPSCMDLELVQPLVEVKGPVRPASDASVPVDAGTVQGAISEPEQDAEQPVPDPDEHEVPPPPSETSALAPPTCVPLSTLVSDTSLMLCWSGAHSYEPARTWWSASSNLF
jgi:hypothetical protein